MFIGTRGTSDYNNINLSFGAEQIWVKRVYKSCSSGAGICCFFIKATSRTVTFSTVTYYAQCALVDITDIMSKTSKVTASTKSDVAAYGSISVTKDKRYIIGLLLGTEVQSAHIYPMNKANILNKYSLTQYYSSLIVEDVIHHESTSGWYSYGNQYSVIAVKIE